MKLIFRELNMFETIALIIEIVGTPLIIAAVLYFVLKAQPSGTANGRL